MKNFKISILLLFFIGYGIQCSDYDSGLEYTLHQRVSDRFFKRITRKQEAIEIIEEFKKDNNKQINLDNLSSRTRILLFRELTAFSCANNISTIHCMFHNNEFKIDLTPSLMQPGYAIISTIGKHRDIYNLLHKKFSSPLVQKDIADRIIKARKSKPYHPSIPNPVIEDLNLEILNILLDFEVARRLQEKQEEQEKTHFIIEIRKLVDYANGVGERSKEKDKKLERVNNEYINRINDFFKYSDLSYEKNLEKEKSKYNKHLTLVEVSDKIKYAISDKYLLDTIPIASAVVGLLKLSSKEESPELLEIFFHAPYQDGNHRDKEGYYYGEFNAFEGKPDSQHRKEAVENIIRKAGLEKKSEAEKIHQEYLEFFGGGSESEGENYDEDECL